MAWIAPLALLVAVPAQAQDPRIELQGSGILDPEQ